MSAFSIVKLVRDVRSVFAVRCIIASLLHFLAIAASAQVLPDGLAATAVADASCLRGARESMVAVIACGDAGCAPIPWQLDERDGDGRWALENGPEPNPDDPHGVLDDNDEVVFMAADAGRRARRAELPAASACLVELRVERGGALGWAYAFIAAGAAARSPAQYVRYDVDADRIEGARVAVGFGAQTPRFLAVRGPDGRFGPNLLDRLKVRAHARFLGIIPLGRDEGDIEYEFAAWHAGPVRVLRREYQWVRLASWLRTPIFETETIMSRDAMALPVRLRLNFPPTYFFGGIEVQAVLDFRALQGWEVAAAGVDPAVVGAGMAERIDGARSDWVALRGPDATLVLELARSPSLASLVPSVVYREGGAPQPPEAVPGEEPAIGYRLTTWSDVDRGAHWFAAIASALPPDADLSEAAHREFEPVAVRAREMAAERP